MPPIKIFDYTAVEAITIYVRDFKHSVCKDKSLQKVEAPKSLNFKNNLKVIRE